MVAENARKLVTFQVCRELLNNVKHYTAVRTLDYFHQFSIFIFIHAKKVELLTCSCRLADPDLHGRYPFLNSDKRIVVVLFFKEFVI